MTNPFESASEQRSKKFTVVYHNEKIDVQAGEHYRLTWPDGRWLVMDCKDDYSKTPASSDAEARQVISCIWVIETSSGGPDWVNREQLQVIGELLKRREQEWQKHSA
ncbi:MAG: hypothetical protein ABIU63_09735 [Chitinophagaceae bacterium]